MLVQTDTELKWRVGLNFGTVSGANCAVNCGSARIRVDILVCEKWRTSLKEEKVNIEGNCNFSSHRH